jgi:hypothetical protein
VFGRFCSGDVLIVAGPFGGGTPPLQKRVTKALKESVLAGVQKLDEKCQPVLKEGI